MAASKIVVCCIVLMLGFLVLILSLIAAFKRVKSNDRYTITSDGNCSHAAAPAAGLGITAAFLVLVMQIIANAYGGCVCCCERNRPSRSRSKMVCAILCLVFSWLIALHSYSLLFAYGVVNSSYQHPTQVNAAGMVVCPVVESGTGLVIGGIFGLIAAILGAMLCALAPSRRQQGLPQQGAAVEMPSSAGAYYPGK